MAALNCEVGDLAIVVNTDLPENLGQIVEVIGLPTGEPFSLSGKGHIWQVRTVSGRETLVYRFNDVVRIVKHVEGPVPDRCLRPVAGLADDDVTRAESESKTPSPRRTRKRRLVVEACLSMD